MKKCGIYKIYCKSNREIYVGSSVQIYQRWNQHRQRLRTNKHTSPYLQNAWTKYGEDAFSFSILEECDKDVLHEREQFWIDKLQPRFNSIKKMFPRIEYSEETRNKISEGLKKTWKEQYGGVPPNWAANLEKAHELAKGRKASDETKAKLSEERRQRWANPEYKEKLKQVLVGHKGRTVTPEQAAEQSAKIKANWDAKTYCKHGHELTEDNIYVVPGSGKRSCYICKKATRAASARRISNNNKTLILTG